MSESKQPKTTQAEGGKARVKAEEPSRHQFTFETAGVDLLSCAPDELMSEAPSSILSHDPSAILRRQPTTPATAGAGSAAQIDHARPTFGGRSFAGVPARAASAGKRAESEALAGPGDRLQAASAQATGHIVEQSGPEARPNAASGERTPPINTNQSGQPLPFLDTLQSSFGRHDLSRVRAHTDRGAAAEAQSLGADAFARGPDVAFSRTPSLHTAAHEAAHVIQQRAGVEVAGGIGQEGDAYERHADQVADRVVSGQSSEALLDAAPGANPARQVAPARPVVQLRRIPPNVRALLTASSGGPGANFAANVAGAERLISLAMGELSMSNQSLVLINRLGGLTQTQFDALPQEERLSRHAEAIVSLFPDFQLGNPSLIDTGPRPATADAANITRVVANADGIFNEIASGAQDANLTQVFGAGHKDAAKSKYARGRTWMNNLHRDNKIVTDRSGVPPTITSYAEEVSQGGLTDFHKLIRVHPDVIDNPDANDSIITLLHESLHAGNSDITDDVYIDAGGFTTQSAAQKLRNSAHFEVVPWRMRDPTNAAAFPSATPPPAFQTFIPAGTTVGGVTAPARTRVEEGAIAAYDLVREAWTTGLNLHLFYVQLFKTPTDWNRYLPDWDRRFSRSLPYWSKVQKLTIHLKTSINPASPDEAQHPVSQIDVALSEGLTRKLAAAMDVLAPLETEADILAFENANATPAELAAAFPGGAHNNRNRERDFLLRLAVRHPGVLPLTGTVERDLRVVNRMGRFDWGTVLDHRDPTSFAD